MLLFLHIMKNKLTAMNSF